MTPPKVGSEPEERWVSGDGAVGHHALLAWVLLAAAHAGIALNNAVLSSGCCHPYIPISDWQPGGQREVVGLQRGYKRAMGGDHKMVPLMAPRSCAIVRVVIVPSDRSRLHQLGSHAKGYIRWVKGVLQRREALLLGAVENNLGAENQRSACSAVDELDLGRACAVQCRGGLSDANTHPAIRHDTIHGGTILGRDEYTGGKSVERFSPGRESQRARRTAKWARWREGEYHLW
jgi:hypothetical protein